MSAETPTDALSPTKVANILDAAAAHIEHVGWLQDDYYEYGKPATDCRVCSMGAINVAMFGHPSPPKEAMAYSAACEIGDLVVNHLSVLGFDLAAWNDEPHRTQGDVTAAMRETAAELRGGAS